MPEKGFNRLDSSWYVNYPSVGEEPSIMLTRRKDSTGYTNMRSCKCIQEDEELLLDYTTPPPLGPAATAATAAFICYICQSEVDKNAPGCVNLRCKCVHSYMHQECADKWFEPRLKLTVSRLSREDQEITCEVTCEMCGGECACICISVCVCVGNSTHPLCACTPASTVLLPNFSVRG